MLADHTFILIHILAHYIISLTNLSQGYMECVWDRIFQKIYGDARYYSQHKLLLSL